MPTPIHQLFRLGQSIWYDNIQRRLLENGELAEMISQGYIRGVTSNPTIFHNAIAKTHDYDPALIPLAWSGWEAEQIFWQLAIEDIREACDLFLPLYRSSEGGDGYVSLEVSPMLAHNTEGTLAQAKQLWEWVGRPNLMVKIPATKEGIPAVRAAIAAGINVNVTLIFLLARYREVMQAYLNGLSDRIAAGQPVSQIASVASFFVSRMDTKVDGLLNAIGAEKALTLRGQAAIAYTKLAYAESLKVFRGEPFARFQTAGCRPQRPLWASTSTKNPAYPDTLYVDGLVGPGTVNTVPPQTLLAFRDHGKAKVTILNDLDGARQTLADLEALGLSMDQVTAELEAEGVKSFAEAFTALLATLDERRTDAVKALGPLAALVSRRVASLVAEAAPGRLWSHDPSLWTTEPAGQAEVRQRLGWLDLPRTSQAAIKGIKDFAAEVGAAGLERILLLGMGGSSLGPEVMSLIFAPLPEGMAFAILDSTDPAQVLEAARQFPPEKSLYLVASKSGGTAEINATFNYFWKLSGEDGSHFAAITDPGTSLEALANARGFRKTFLADPSVGGRYSALTHFGLVPAGLMGIDLERLLGRAEWMMRQCAAEVSGARNPGLVLGAVLGQAAVSGRDKLTFLADEAVAPLGAWLEQLIAESTGKLGKGILPVDGETIGDPAGYGDDRLFVYLRRGGKMDAQVEALRKAGQPALVFDFADAYDLGAEFYRWETATAYACAILGVNAFDQPDVQDAKDRTKAKIAEYVEKKMLDEGRPIWEGDGMKVYTVPQVEQVLQVEQVQQVLEAFLGMAKKNDYVAINAYLPRNEEMDGLLQQLRAYAGEKTGCATTSGFGPRFLHSTGQLHKGGPDEGLFLQITADPVEDVSIPTQNMSFGTLERAQALGDFEALAARGRRILRLHLPSPEALKGIVAAVSAEVS
jgi:transaldolase/glucose-6-phosphate isomerase